MQRSSSLNCSLRKHVLREVPGSKSSLPTCLAPTGNEASAAAPLTCRRSRGPAEPLAARAVLVPGRVTDTGSQVERRQKSPACPSGCPGGSGILPALEALGDLSLASSTQGPADPLGPRQEGGLQLRRHESKLRNIQYLLRGLPDFIIFTIFFFFWRGNQARQAG